MRTFATIGWLLLAGCGPVLTPVKAQDVAQGVQALAAHTSPPRVVWIVDKSESMNDWLDPGDPSGPAKLAVLRSWFSEALVQLAAPARHGLVLFPADQSCGAPATFTQEVPAVDDGSLARVVASVAAVAPGGGTPTAATLHFVGGAVAPDPTTRTIVVLVTDGLPNCNTTNLNSCKTPVACRCTLASCGPEGSPYCTLGCLDDANTIGATQELANLGFELLVVGLGQDVGGPSSDVLRSFVQPLARRCALDSDCHAGSRCDVEAGLCQERFFQVTTEADLSAPLRRVAQELTESARCAWFLDQDVSTGTLSVAVGGVEVPVGAEGYELSSGRQLRLHGAACAKLLADASLTPVLRFKP